MIARYTTPTQRAWISVREHLDLEARRHDPCTRGHNTAHLQGTLQMGFLSRQLILTHPMATSEHEYHRYGMPSRKVQ